MMTAPEMAAASALTTEMEFLPVVKAYPALSRTYGEVSCVAGVEMGDMGPTGWIRLYPVPFRALGEEQQFRKFQPIRLRVSRPRSDRRPETRRPDRDSIELSRAALSTRNGWAARRPWIEPLMLSSMCEIRRRQKINRTSLGIFRPAEVLDLVIEPVSVSASKKQIAHAWAAQGSLLDVPRDERRHQVRALELMPYAFKYRYRCDDDSCPVHEQSLIDWEVFRYYQRVRTRPDWEKRMRDRFIGDLCAADRDTAFVVGNQHQHRDSFLVLAVWWPPRQEEQLRLA
jgi:hypothetical protein